MDPSEAASEGEGEVGPDEKLHSAASHSWFPSKQSHSFAEVIWSVLILLDKTGNSRPDDH